MLVVLVSSALTVCGGGATEDPARESIDEVAGSFRGVKLGDKPAAAREVFGSSCEGEEMVNPCGVEAGAITAPHSFPGEWGHESYEGVTVFTLHGGIPVPPRFRDPRSDRITAFLITDADAETSKGVRLGDSLDLAKRRYPGMDCGLEQFHDSTGNPLCS